MNFRGCVVSRDGGSVSLVAGSIRLEVPASEFDGLQHGAKVEVGLRPSKMDLAAEGDLNAISGKIILVENMAARRRSSWMSMVRKCPSSRRRSGHS